MESHRPAGSLPLRQLKQWSRRQLIAGIVAAAAAFAWTRAVLRLRRLISEAYSRRFLWLSSPLPGSTQGLALPLPPSGWRHLLSQQIPDRWRGYCPNCKRPISAGLSEKWWKKRPAESVRGKNAYVIFLWGSSKEYVLGAMVLGHSIRRTGSTHARVCLHTSDVPEGLLKLLSQLWDCRLIDHVDAATDKLSTADNAHRFAKVFTKLRGLELVDFAKVLIMDIDLLVTSNIDELFELQAPAACRRGMNQSRWPLKTGDPLDGRAFFMGRDPTKWSWGQGTGINAGVMLWQPDVDVFEEMQAEIIEPNHPEHMKGNGPEQDYLSRFWADAPWSHIGVEYNFQLHQMFFSLHPDCAGKVERSILPQTPEKIKIVHFSGESTAKPWHRVLDPSFESFWPERTRDAEYVEMYADEFQGHWLWIKKDPAMWESTLKTTRGWDMEKMFLGEDNQIYRWPEDKGQEPWLVEIDEAAHKGTMDFLANCLGQWFDTLQDLEKTMSCDLKHALLQVSEEEEAKPKASSKGPPWRVARDSLLSDADTAPPSQAGTGTVGGGCGASGSEVSANIGKCTGTVSSVSPDKGYGFVTASDGKSHYFHMTKFVDGAFSTFPEQGHCLTFDLEASPIKPGQLQCCNISRGSQRSEDKASQGSEQSDKAAIVPSRLPGGAWSVEERSPAGGGKLSIICGAVEASCFATFVEGGSEVYSCRDDELSTVFVKVAGSHLCRRFDVPLDVGSDRNRIAEALEPLQVWTDTVPEGSILLLAIVGLGGVALEVALGVLAPLGVPDVLPPPSCRVLAAIGTARQEVRQGATTKPEIWYETHASCDIAHVTKEAGQKK